MKSHVKESGGAFNCSPRQASQANRLGRPSGRHMSNAISPSLPIHPSIKHSVRVCVCLCVCKCATHLSCKLLSQLWSRATCMLHCVLSGCTSRCAISASYSPASSSMWACPNSPARRAPPPRCSDWICVSPGERKQDKKKKEEEEKMLLNQNGKSTAPEPLIMCNQMSERRREPRKTHKKCQKYFASLRLYAWYACPAWEWVPHRPTLGASPFTLCGQCAQSWPQFEFDAFCLVAAFACPVSSLSLFYLPHTLCPTLRNIRVQCLYKFCIIFAILLRTLS